MHRCLAAAFLLLAASTEDLAGQTVTGIRDLDFGFVVRGVASTVSPSDPIRSGRFYIKYVVGGRVKVNFTLPAALNRVGGGATLAIQFRNGDAAWQETAPGSAFTVFNPNGVSNIHPLVASPDMYVYLGGRVSPTASQLTGAYTGTVVLIATFF
jgi:hypothetical protein